MKLPYNGYGVSLETFQIKHIDELQAWVPEVRDRLIWGGSDYACNDLKGRLKKDLQLAHKSRTRILLRVRKNEQAIGHLQFVNIDRRNRAAHLARVLICPQLRGQGLGLLTIKSALNLAFNEIGLHRLSLFVFEENAIALQCYKRAGFKQEGLLRDRTKVGNFYWSSIVMAILAEDFKKA